MDNPLYIIDSREQKPYSFTGPSVVATLDTGDYSLAGLESQVAIERKEINDLIGCLTTERERFERELQRGRSLDYFALVAECSLQDLANGRYRSEMNVKAAVQSLLTMSVRFRLPVWLVHNRAHGQRITQSLLDKYAAGIEWRWKQLQKGMENGKQKPGGATGVDRGRQEEYGAV